MRLPYSRSASSMRSEASVTRSTMCLRPGGMRSDLPLFMSYMPTERGARAAEQHSGSAPVSSIALSPLRTTLGFLI